MNEVLTKFAESAQADLLKDIEALNRYLREKGLGQGEIDSISSLYDEVDALKDADTKLKIAVEALSRAYKDFSANAKYVCASRVKQALEKIGES